MANIVKADPEAVQKMRSRRILKITGGFLLLMALLTFFSNTINNLSLPRVKVENPTSGTLSREITGTGEVLANKQTEQSFDEAGIDIAEVLAEEGDIVEKGQVLVVLDREKPDMTEVETLERALEKSKEAYEKKKDSYEEPDALDIELASTEALKTYQKAIETYWEAVDQYNFDMAGYNTGANFRYASETSAPMMPNQMEEKYWLNGIFDIYLYQKDVREYETGRRTVEENLRDATEAYEEAKLAYFKFVRTQEKDQSTEAKKYQDFLDELENDREQIKYDEEAIRKKRKDLTKSNDIEADASGVLKTISAKVDAKTTTEVMFVIVDTSHGFEYKTSLLREQVQRLAKGDSVDIQVPNGSGRYIRGAVREFKDIKDDPTRQEVYIDLEAEGTNLLGGESGGLEMTKRSRNYDMLLPNAAIREDQDTTYILMLQEERGPLGNTYVVKRMDVEVTEKDNFKTAITTNGGWPENVVVSSDKPISDNSRVMPER